MRLRARKDANQPALVAFAEAFGASFMDLSQLGKGRPDGLLGLHGKTFLVEFKTVSGALTPDQTAFIASWRGSPVHIVRTVEDMERLLRTVVPNKRAPKKAKMGPFLDTTTDESIFALDVTKRQA
jgi:hypothetical protein